MSKSEVATVTKQCEWCDKQYQKGINAHPNFHDLGICASLLEEQVRLAKVTLDI